ncbi:hypothetical protein [Globicatella sanguinis]
MDKQQAIEFLEEQRDARLFGLDPDYPSDFDKWQLEQAETFQEVIDWVKQLEEPVPPTQKQLKFIKVIEEEWGYGKFTGTTKQEASQYISKCVDSQSKYEMEMECSDYEAPNQ